jgi:RIO-like serine/threonine protein kinase
MNHLDLSVLRALARLSRARKNVDSEAIALRASGSLDEARASVGRLARLGLVDRTERGMRLTLAGLAVAVASGAPAVAAARPSRERVARRRAA